MEKEQLLKRIEDLEQRVQALEARHNYGPVLQTFMPVFPNEYSRQQAGYNNPITGL
jgi:hypothetical protein